MFDASRIRATLSRLALLALSGCAATPAPKPTPAIGAASTATDRKPAAVAPQIAAFAMPKAMSPSAWYTLGPFPLVTGENAPHASLDHDYLQALGGESQVKLDANVVLDVAGASLRARRASDDGPRRLRRSL